MFIVDVGGVVGVNVGVVGVDVGVVGVDIVGVCAGVNRFNVSAVKR